MEARFRSWWQYICEHWVVVVTILALVIVIVALIIIGYGFDLTGFHGYNQVTTAYTTSGPSAGTVVRTEVYQPNKTLWDWLQLLIIPGVLVIIGLLFNSEQKRREDKTTTDNQREATLKEYVDKISELLLKEHLGERTADGKLNPEYEQVRNVARVQTITVLTQLDARRVGYVFTFLREAGLMSTTSNDNVVSLSEADLRAVNWRQASLSNAYLFQANLTDANLGEANLIEANLSNAYLLQANLSKALLHQADLSRASLNGANLSRASLIGATLHQADLSKATLDGADLKGGIGITIKELEKQAKSLKGATMPDGSIHP